MRYISILGSTGSIGTQSLDVISRLGGIRISALTAGGNIELLERQLREFKPAIAAVMDEKKAEVLRNNIKDLNIKVYSGIDGLIKAAEAEKADTIINAVVGNVGLRPTLAAIKAGKNIALANKETLVSAGELVMKEAKKNKVNIYPVDSEHSAIFQCLQGNEGNKIEKILLTASGGPFRQRMDLSNITLDDALNHPNWSMGKKITVDSATLMNKGLEVIEAKWLFNVEPEQIEVLVHPQSIIHSMVQFEDGSVIAQLGEPDMRLPIQYAITYPQRVKNTLPRLDLFTKNELSFEKPDTQRFKCLSYALDAIKTGGTLPAAMNAANETAVWAFINGEIGFLDIEKLIKKAVSAYNVVHDYSLEDVFAADEWSRLYTRKAIAERNF